jgi:hypothetical protein
MIEIVMHRGAGEYASDNSHSAMQWALANTPDRVEIDLLEKDGQVWLAHDPEHILADSLLLPQAEEMLRGSGLQLMLDLKNYTPALLRQTIETFARPEWQDRIIVSSHVSQDARMVAREIPGARSSWSLPQVDLSGVNVPAPKSHYDMLHWRDILPERIEDSLRFRCCDLLSVQYELLSPALFHLCRCYGVGIYAWTAHGKDKLDELRKLPLQGVVSEVTC